ncbi:MAG: hypothetical protein JKY65_22845 [Planctomycetes bacterium]|nr:hypothetical protein [Planctomycetota bacterium]
MRNARRLALLGLVSFLGYGCASSAPRSEDGAASAGADLEQAEQAPSTPAPLKKREPTDLSPDPYRKIPGGKESPPKGKPLAPATLKPPTIEPSPTPRKLNTPARLAVSFVRKGHFLSSGSDLLRLEASLARDPGLSGVVGHALPRGPARTLLSLGVETRDAGRDLLLVVTLPEKATATPGRAWLLHCQDKSADPLLIARFEAIADDAEPPPTDAGFTSDEPDSIAGLIARIGAAHRKLRPKGKK